MQKLFEGADQGPLAWSHSQETSTSRSCSYRLSARMWAVAHAGHASQPPTVETSKSLPLEGFRAKIANSASRPRLAIQGESSLFTGPEHASKKLSAARYQT